jgi:hypothetical protein
MLLDTTLPNLCQEFIFRAERPDVHDPPSAAPLVVEDQEPPAAIVLANIGTGEVHGTPCLLRSGLVPEERASVRKDGKDALVIEEFVLVRVNRHRGIFISIIVMDEEPVVSVILLDHVNIPEITAALPALEAFE